MYSTKMVLSESVLCDTTSDELGVDKRGRMKRGDVVNEEEW